MQANGISSPAIRYLISKDGYNVKCVISGTGVRVGGLAAGHMIATGPGQDPRTETGKSSRHLYFTDTDCRDLSNFGHQYFTKLVVALLHVLFQPIQQ